VALNCCVRPAAIEGFPGATAIATSAGGPTETLVEPVMLPETALIFALPCVRALAMPEVLIDTVAGWVEFQDTDAVMSREVPLLY